MPEPGQYYLVNHSVPYETVPQAGSQAVALASRVANPRSFYALRDDPASPRRKLLDSFLTQYTASRQVWSESEFEKLTQQLLDLIVMSIVEPNQQASPRRQQPTQPRDQPVPPIVPGRCGTYGHICQIVT